MGTLLRLTKWACRAWPVLVIGIIVCAHLLLLNYFSQWDDFINKTAALVSLLVGGLIILYSINSNIGIIKQKSLISELSNYLKEFPLIKRPIAIELQGTAMTISAIKSNISVDRKAQSTDEKIEYLQERINEVSRELEQESKELNKKIDHLTNNMSTQIQDAKTSLRGLESKMDEVYTGDLKVQLFGVLLIIYGAIAGYAV
ncbi:hypothetical protein [Acidihalobacter ferrooxydans]|uniref:hypothetical protein n=1 Tax=Acidihalobacter ferrooxydans TaxID=1765967 RepID=UPI0012EC6D23|nr:hypothetical protein [Acidihalobacter ferrooxydans]